MYRFDWIILATEGPNDDYSVTVESHLVAQLAFSPPLTLSDNRNVRCRVTMRRMSPEQRELCRLLSPLHERFCEKHCRTEEIPSGSASQKGATSTRVDFSLAKFRSALDELWEAAKDLDRSLKRHDESTLNDLRKCDSGTMSLDLIDAPGQDGTRRQRQA